MSLSLIISQIYKWCGVNGSFRETKIYAGSIRFTHILKSVKTRGTQIYRTVDNSVNKKLFTVGKQRIFVHASKREVTKTLKWFQDVSSNSLWDKVETEPGQDQADSRSETSSLTIPLFEIYLLFISLPSPPQLKFRQILALWCKDFDARASRLWQCKIFPHFAQNTNSQFDYPRITPRPQMKSWPDIGTLSFD